MTRQGGDPATSSGGAHECVAGMGMEVQARLSDYEQASREGHQKEGSTRWMGPNGRVVHARQGSHLPLGIETQFRVALWYP